MSLWGPFLGPKTSANRRRRAPKSPISPNQFFLGGYRFLRIFRTRFFMNFGLPGAPCWLDFRPTFVVFWGTVGSHVVFLCSKVLGEGAGSDFGCLGTLPGRILAGIWVISCITPVVRGAQVLSQLRPKFVQISDQSVLRRRFFPLLILPFS